MSQNTTSLSLPVVLTFTALVFNTLLTLPTILLFIQSLSGRRKRTTPRFKADIYEDEDGTASGDACKAQSSRLPKYLSVFGSLLGFGIALFEIIIFAIREAPVAHLAEWFTLSSWVRWDGDVLY